MSPNPNICKKWPMAGHHATAKPPILPHTVRQPCQGGSPFESSSSHAPSSPPRSMQCSCASRRVRPQPLGPPAPNNSYLGGDGGPGTGKGGEHKGAWPVQLLGQSMIQLESQGRQKCPPCWWCRTSDGTWDKPLAARGCEAGCSRAGRPRAAGVQPACRRMQARAVRTRLPSERQWLQVTPSHLRDALVPVAWGKSTTAVEKPGD